MNKNIIKIRKELDKLDDKLLSIIKKRTKFVDLVIKNKKFKKDIIDRKRISIILKNIAIKSRKKKIDHKAINRHPILGRINMKVTVDFFEFHYNHHLKAINLLKN